MAERYQNALLYGPGMAAGRHPEVSANTIGRPSVSMGAPTAQPMTFDPYVSAMGAYSSAAPNFQTFDAPDAGPQGGNALAGAVGAAGFGLAPMAIKGALKAGEYLAKPGTQDALDIIPQVQYGGSAAGLVPADANPFNTDLFYAPNGLDLGVGDAGFYGAGGFAAGAAPQATTAADVAAAYDAPFSGSASWTGAYDAAGAPIMTGGGAEGGLEGGLDGASAVAGGFDLVNAGLSFGGGALGSWGGSKLAKGLVRGDPEDQGTASAIGGTIGGAVGSFAGPVGTMIGSFLGSLAAGTLAAGEPDDPYAFSSGNITGGPNGPQLYFGPGGAMNHADPSAGTEMGSRLTQYINSRAAAEGYAINPEMINQGVGSIGYMGGPDATYFYSEPGHAPGEDQHAWTGSGFNDLGNSLYGTLLGGGFLARPGTTADWNTVNQDLATQAAGADPGYAPIYSGSPMGQYNASWQTFTPAEANTGGG